MVGVAPKYKQEDLLAELGDYGPLNLGFAVADMMGLFGWCLASVRRHRGSIRSVLMQAVDGSLWRAKEDGVWTPVRGADQGICGAW